MQSRGSGALGRLKSGVSARPRLPGSPEALSLGSPSAGGHLSHQRSLPEQEMSSGFLCPHPHLTPRPTPRLGFGRWGKPGLSPCPRTGRTLSHPHPKTGLLPLSAPGWRRDGRAACQLHASHTPGWYCLFRTSGREPSSPPAPVHLSPLITLSGTLLQVT